MKLLISPINEEESRQAIAGGADIIDVKNPQEGALGASFPWIIRKIKKNTPTGIEVSCALGDVPNLPGSISLASLGAATLGVDYIKVGLYGAKTEDDAVFLLKQVKRAAKEYNPKIKVVAAGYADAQKIGTLKPSLIPKIAYDSEVDVAMLDTAIKDGVTLFIHQTPMQLKTFVKESHDYGLLVAFAGSLRKRDLPILSALESDIVGLRGAACTNSDRNHGHITRELVEELVDSIKQAKRP